MTAKKRYLEQDTSNTSDIYNLAVWESLLEDDEIGPMEEAFMRGYLNTEGSV